MLCTGTSRQAIREFCLGYREILTLNVGRFQWSSRKGTDLFGMLHRKELLLVDEIHRKISTQRKEAAWAGKAGQLSDVPRG